LSSVYDDLAFLFGGIDVRWLGEGVARDHASHNRDGAPKPHPTIANLLHDNLLGNLNQYKDYKPRALSQAQHR
jgi:hypothetical protein